MAKYQGEVLMKTTTNVALRTAVVVRGMLAKEIVGLKI